ncbi:hybrid sensory histidine kinase BarA [compost metagenome]
MTKPISPERLYAVISYWLKQSEAAIASVEASKNRLSDASWQANSSIPSLNGMDMKVALERVNGKLPILLHMMEQFVIDYEDFVKQLRELLAESELSTVRRMVHTLKGAAGYLSAFELLQAVQELEPMVKHPEQHEDQLQPVIDKLEVILGQLLDELRSIHTPFDNIS